MGHRLRMAVGVLGNATSVLLYAAPTLTFARVIRNKSTEEFSCIPYIIALLNALLYAWYGLPVVSHKWENFPLITVNSAGFFFEAFFVLTYFWFTSARGKIKVAVAVVPAILVFCATAVLSAFVFHDHHHRKLFVGSVGLVVSAAMYGSPLVAMKRVIQTNSVEYMPFYLSLFSFLASSIWMTYGLLSHDVVLAAPNFVGSPLGFLQLVLYFAYKRREIMQEPSKWDLENNTEKTRQLSEVITGNTNNTKV